MGDETPKFNLPYPVGTDAVRDGDNYMQALAEAVDTLFSSVISRSAFKTVGWDDVGGAPDWAEVPGSQIFLHVDPPGALVYLKAQTVIGDTLGPSGEPGVLYVATRIDADDASLGQWFEHGPDGWVESTQWRYFLGPGVFDLHTQVKTGNPGYTFDMPAMVWQAYGFGANFVFSFDP